MKGEGNLTFFGIGSASASECASWAMPLGVSPPSPHTQNPTSTVKAAASADTSGSRPTTGS